MLTKKELEDLKKKTKELNSLRVKINHLVQDESVLFNLTNALMQLNMILAANKHKMVK